MKVIRYWAKEQIRCEDIPKPVIGAGDALIEVAFAGICGTDMFIYSGAHPRATRARAHHETLAFPRDLFFYGEGRVPESFLIFLGTLFPTLTHDAALDHNVVLVGDAVNSNGAEGKRLKLHSAPPAIF
jgi:threonine dehydrogenase-like Zn-dependent dehydrogenase